MEHARGTISDGRSNVHRYRRKVWESPWTGVFERASAILKETKSRMRNIRVCERQKHNQTDLKSHWRELLRAVITRANEHYTRAVYIHGHINWPPPPPTLTLSCSYFCLTSQLTCSCNFIMTGRDCARNGRCACVCAKEGGRKRANFRYSLLRFFTCSVYNVIFFLGTNCVSILNVYRASAGRS